MRKVRQLRVVGNIRAASFLDGFAKVFSGCFNFCFYNGNYQASGIFTFFINRYWFFLSCISLHSTGRQEGTQMGIQAFADIDNG